MITWVLAYNTQNIHIDNRVIRISCYKNVRENDENKSFSVTQVLLYFGVFIWENRCNKKFILYALFSYVMGDWERLEKAPFLVNQSALVIRGNTLEACESEKLSRACEDKKNFFSIQSNQRYHVSHSCTRVYRSTRLIIIFV